MNAEPQMNVATISKAVAVARDMATTFTSLMGDPPNKGDAKELENFIEGLDQLVDFLRTCIMYK